MKYSIMQLHRHSIDNDGKGFAVYVGTDYHRSSEMSRHHTEKDAWNAIKRYSDERRRFNEKKIADHVDGYDRDDLGESPDY